MTFFERHPSIRRVIDLAVDVLTAALAMVGVQKELAHSPWGVVWILTAVVVVTAQLVQTGLERGGDWSPVGRSLVLRTALVAAAAVVYSQGGSGSSQAVGAILGAAILIGSIACEPWVSRAARASVPLAVRLPNVAVFRSRRDLGWLAVSTSLAATGAAVLIAVLGGSPWWWELLALLAVSPVGYLVLVGRAKITFTRRLRSQVPAAVARYAPDFIVYTSRPDDASYQIAMWLPYLQRSGLRFLIVTRNRVPASALAELTDVPVVEARGISDLDALVVPSLKAAFYVNASSGNGALVRFRHLTHVYLGHGDSDKPPSYNPTHSMYDLIFAAGPAATRRYAAHGVKIPMEKFRIVGRPQVENVQPAQRSISEVANPVVLYAPTWRGHVEETMLYSLPTGERIVSALLSRGATVIFRPHPFSYDFVDDAVTINRIQAMLAADARQTGRSHLWGPAAERERGILDCMNASDAMVSDVSSVVSDYLFSGKPFAMIAVPSDPISFTAEYPVARASYAVRGDLADLDVQLDQMFGSDPMAQERADVRVDYLGDFPSEDYAAEFVHAVRDAAGARRVDRDTDDEESEEDAEDRSETEDGELGTGGPVPSGRNWSRYLQFARRAALDLIGTAIAVCALAAALFGSPPWLVLLLAAGSLWPAFQSVSATVATPSRWPRLLTEGDTTRTVLVVALLVVADRGTGSLQLWALSCLMLLITIVAERRIRAAWGDFGLTVRYLPEAMERIRELVPRGLLPLVGSLITLIGFALVTLSWSPVVLLIITSGFLAVSLEVTMRALWRAGKVESAETRLRDALVAREPRFVVYFASTVGAQYQVGMWLPYFLRIGRPFIFVTRSVPMLLQLEALCTAAQVEVPIIFRPTLRSLEEVIVDSMTTSFYVNNAARNTHFIERRELTHVWLNHGDSEKPACFNPVHAIYDLIFSAGQAGIDRYARHGVTIPAEKFRIVGRPQVELIRPQRGPIGDLDDQTVLYAPTWQGPFADSRVYSLPVGRQIVDAVLARGARVIFRAHPFNYRYPDAVDMITAIGAVLDADRAATGREHLWGPAAEQEMSIEDCFNASDAMISDVSAVVSDYLHSGKPFAIVSVGREPDQLLVDVPAARAAYVLREDLENLVGVCDDLLGADPLASLRNETKVYYLGDFPDENYAEGFLSTARAVIDRT